MRLTRIAYGVALTVVPAILPAQESTETIIVSATRTEILESESPVAISVITALDLERTPADDFGDLLRTVPGLNISQTSARDINVTGRGSTNTLSNSLLTLMDGRSTYLDFFGINMWDMLPVQANEIQQIEVIRGPGSALYGANAMSGVVNIITKHPKDMAGTTVTLGTPYANIVHAAGDEAFAYKLTAGYFEEDAYDRPTGIVPGSNPQSSYPPYINDGTDQKRFNSRFDFGLGSDSSLTLGAGFATTDGIIHSGIGPFDIDGDTELSYFQVDYTLGSLQIGVSAQMLDGDAQNLLTRDATGQPLGFRFINDTYNVELTNTSVIGENHIVTYGGNLRTHDFDLTIAPQARSKDEWGLFIQDDIRLSDKLRWVVGLRYDDIDPLTDTVLTPRTSLIYSHSQDHTFRISYNEAFRTPSTVNSFLGVTILQPLDPSGTLVVTGDAVGNIGLTEESLKAWEIGWVGNFDDVMDVSVSIYRNETTGSIDFYESDHYDATNPPMPFPNWPAGFINCFFIPPGTSMLCPQGGIAGVVPSDYSYRNIGKSIDKGIEVSFEWDLLDADGAPYLWANLSWQDDPEVTGADLNEVNRAPEWRANFGIGMDDGPFFWNANISYQGKAYWADVLFAKAETDSFTQLNASLGWRFKDDSMTFKLIGQNLNDERVQQHIFGDILERRFDAQISFSF